MLSILKKCEEVGSGVGCVLVGVLLGALVGVLLGASVGVVLGVSLGALVGALLGAVGALAASSMDNAMHTCCTVLSEAVPLKRAALFRFSCNVPRFQQHP